MRGKDDGGREGTEDVGGGRYMVGVAIECNEEREEPGKEGMRRCRRKRDYIIGIRARIEIEIKKERRERLWW